MLLETENSIPPHFRCISHEKRFVTGNYNVINTLRTISEHPELMDSQRNYYVFTRVENIYLCIPIGHGSDRWCLSSNVAVCI